jgi:MFS family permease
MCFVVFVLKRAYDIEGRNDDMSNEAMATTTTTTTTTTPTSKTTIGGATGKRGGTYAALLANPTQRAVVAMTSCVVLCYSVQIAVVPLHATAVWGATPGQLGLMFSVASGAGLLGAPLGGWAADRFGRKLAIGAPAVLAAASLAALPFATTAATFTGSLISLSLALSLLNPGLTALAADIAPPDRRAAALSLSRQASDIMFTAAPLGLGALVSTLCTFGHCILITFCRR